MVLPSIFRETLADVHSILLHCLSLTTLELKSTRLGYDGILYICSPLRNNTTLRYLAIHDDLQLPTSRSKRNNTIVYFRSEEMVPMPAKTSCTDFLLELNSILYSGRDEDPVWIIPPSLCWWRWGVYIVSG